MSLHRENPSVLKTLSDSQSSGAHSAFTGFLSSCQVELSFFDWQRLLHPSEKERKSKTPRWFLLSQWCRHWLANVLKKRKKKGRKERLIRIFLFCKHFASSEVFCRRKRNSTKLEWILNRLKLKLVGFFLPHGSAERMGGQCYALYITLDYSY